MHDVNDYQALSSDGAEGGEEEGPTKNQLGTINGVYVPCLLNILGAVLFLRIGYSVGYAGIVFTCLIFSGTWTGRLPNAGGFVRARGGRVV